MKTVIMSLVFMAMPAWADNTLLVKNNCFACHNVDQTVVGPAFKDVANKYRGQADAADRLAKKNTCRWRWCLGNHAHACTSADTRIGCKKISSLYS